MTRQHHSTLGVARRIVTGLVAATVLAGVPVTPAAARQSCYGCNVIDEGTFGPSLVGKRVFFRFNNQTVAVTVIDVDYASRRLSWRSDSGQTGWDFASHYYTPARSSERDVAIAGGAAATVVTLACVFGLCSDNSSNRSSAPSASDRYQQQYDCKRQCERNTNYSSDQSWALGKECMQRCERAY